MDFLSFATGGMPNMLSYNGTTPTTSPAAAIDPNQKKGVDNVVKILGTVTGLAGATANVISAIKGNPVITNANTGNAYGGLATGNMTDGYTLNEVSVSPSGSGLGLGVQMEHKVDTKPLWLLGGAAAVLYFLTRK